ncbi:MAG: hypothetical protein JWL86_6137 [Rhizobium sp.]|nr:hypothetical protein [Rhizobium sp.]
MGKQSVAHKNVKGTSMRFLLAIFLGIAGLLTPYSAFAESADVEAVIEGVDEDHLTLVLDDGKKYQAPEEFNFDGLKKGVKVVVFYTETDGKRVINDLQIVE